MNLHSYGDVYALGHRLVMNIFDDEVTIEEKVDGSLFAFGIIDGAVCFRSKGTELFVDSEGKCNQNMFQKAVDTARRLFAEGHLHENWIYYGEYLQKPKHNVLVYDRVPVGNIIIFDIMVGDQNFLPYEQKKHEAELLGLECVPLLHRGKVTNFEELKSNMENISILGGQKIEGMVVKNYGKFTPDKKSLKGKYVSEQFKETHRKDWKADTDKHDILFNLIGSLRTDARWHKAIQHLKEKGELTNSPKDIGNLMKEVQVDIEKEEIDYIKDMLYKHFKRAIMSGCIKGLPEWYKELLAKSNFEGPKEND